MHCIFTNLKSPTMKIAKSFVISSFYLTPNLLAVAFFVISSRLQIFVGQSLQLASTDFSQFLVSQCFQSHSYIAHTFESNWIKDNTVRKLKIISSYRFITLTVQTIEAVAEEDDTFSLNSNFVIRLTLLFRFLYKVSKNQLLELLGIQNQAQDLAIQCTSLPFKREMQ